jgi:hypothetical protein
VSTPWPYDADERDPLTALRIAVVASPYPSWFYLVSLCINDEPDTWWRGLRPADDEVALLVDELAYERAWYRPGYVTHMAERPFDIDSGFNSLTFLKRGEGDWAYRRRTWEYGPAMRPSTFDGEQSVDLASLLDRIHEGSSRWTRWKSGNR